MCRGWDGPQGHLSIVEVHCEPACALEGHFLLTTTMMTRRTGTERMTQRNCFALSLKVCYEICQFLLIHRYMTDTGALDYFI